MATQNFGRDGYDDSKWVDIASTVGVGATALYHYFESKLHCLYVIMADAIEASLHEFESAIAGAADYPSALLSGLRSGFDHDDFAVLRLRVLVSKQGLAGVPRQSPREEEARQLARERARDLEFAWATFLVRGWSRATYLRLTHACSPMRSWA
ncbi:TetR/AcrR family transcriptional regulator [Acrocarpospora catenulata]|uniref:TetR/AcrR family transcriptional regulator n=1 Tax=Acrocarpospora catenulata TaxID=2836182 RepID=UPI001BD94D42|nr:TetR/AcrR family transcriptional regulator [Acrocarpospora catenulata]